MKYLIAEINYGGRVTDKEDVFCITALLSKYFLSKVLDDSLDYAFDKNGHYKSPKELDLE